MKKTYLTLALAFMVTVGARAQQDPHYTQYMYNMNEIGRAHV